MCCRFNFKDMNLHFECSQEHCSLNNCKRQEAPGRFLPPAGHAVKLSNQARAAQTGRKDECMWHKTFHHNNGLRHRHKTTSGFISTLKWLSGPQSRVEPQHYNTSPWTLAYCFSLTWYAVGVMFWSGRRFVSVQWMKSFIAYKAEGLARQTNVS